jgi:hypothetical protein
VKVLPELTEGANAAPVFHDKTRFAAANPAWSMFCVVLKVNVPVSPLAHDDGGNDHVGDRGSSDGGECEGPLVGSVDLAPPYIGYRDFRGIHAGHRLAEGTLRTWPPPFSIESPSSPASAEVARVSEVAACGFLTCLNFLRTAPRSKKF